MTPRFMESLDLNFLIVKHFDYKIWINIDSKFSLY